MADKSNSMKIWEGMSQINNEIEGLSKFMCMA